MWASLMGAADRRSPTLANRLVANPPTDPTIEVTEVGFRRGCAAADVAYRGDRCRHRTRR